MVCEVEAGLPRERLFPFVPLSLSLSLSLSLALFVLLSSFRKTFTVKNNMAILICNLFFVKDLPIVD